MATLPATIGKYRIERELGRGASGTVYLGYDPFRSRQVAIKQIHAHLLADPGQNARYRKLLHNEAILAGRLSHPHIVQLLDVDEDADQPYLVLEYVEGGPLADYATPDQLLPVATVLDLAFKCCHALEHAQRQGLVHRDIKPANLLLRRDGELKLADFGAALMLSGDETQLAGLVGSPSYMSPEQVMERPLTHHSDMFSLGVVIYELLTGRRPFDGDSNYATIYRISTVPAPSLLLARQDLPPRLDEVVARALAKKAQDRYATWTDFADALLDVNRELPSDAAGSEAERFQQLRALAFFQDFHDVALWEALRLGTWHRLDAGTILMAEGSPGDSFHLLMEGRVAISRNGIVLSTIDAGVSIGEMTYLQSGQQMRTATATAATDVFILVIRNEALRQASAELQAQFDKAFIKLLVGRLVATNRQIAH